ncbi:hypothetical protein M1N23_02525 [Dehalococcoidia bacterium]|nr:hypothetical protein [Dehalococcoidia bacterium]
MVKNLGVTWQISDGNKGNEDKLLPKYLIDIESEATVSRSLPLLIASRRCYLCQQADEDAPTDSDLQQFIHRIVEHCSAERDYLLPDTPLKEAIFRVLLANGNEPMDAEEVSAILTEKWAMTPFPRNTAAEVITRLAESSWNYLVDRVPQPVTVLEDPEPGTYEALDGEPSEEQSECE